jgi:hypothetical protein
MSHGVGTLVKARGREWVVLPGSTEGLLKLRPLGGAQAEETGILTSLERVDPRLSACRTPQGSGTSAPAVSFGTPCA